MNFNDTAAAAAWLAEQAALNPRLADRPAAADEDIESFRCDRCRAEFPDHPMAERLGECADCQRRMLLGADAAQ